MNKPYFLAAAILLVASPAFADPKVGTIRICRYPGISSMSDHKLLTIPAGSQFAQAKEGSDTSGADIKTLETVHIGAAQSCVTARAAVTWDSLPVPVNYKDRLHQGFDNGSQFKVNVVGGFK